ncbi:Ras- protein Rab-3C [Saguinus oedipus]|uniref:small monomeric GTPase n=1 Tax=Saguinus oedipus TaxID=9490 RepID=A0ABQ9W8E2_SAGOE|nr:Ras- protein Rab-3C [Saguinus oedipus]
MHFTMASAQDARYGQKDSSDQNFDYMFKLLIIGNSSVGKTSFLFRYADDSFTSAFVSTVGIDFKVKTVFKNEKRIKLQIWTSATQIDLICNQAFPKRCFLPSSETFTTATTIWCWYQD